jgi:hypothetical protein
MNASLGPERVFGFGGDANVAHLVELLCEVAWEDGQWRLGAPRWLDPAVPLGLSGPALVGEWLHQPSLTTRFGPPPQVAGH